MQQPGPDTSSRPPAAAAESPHQSVGPIALGDEWLTLIRPHLSEEEWRTFARLRVETAPDPVPSGHLCRSPLQLGVADFEGGEPRVVICTRNLLFFAAFSGEVATAFMLRPQPTLDDALLAYAQLYGQLNRDRADEPLGGDPARLLPCHFLEYLFLRAQSQASNDCESHAVDRERLGGWLTENLETTDESLLQEYARRLGVSRTELIDRLPQDVARGLFAHLFLFAVLHEAGHFHLGHLGAVPGGCEAVVQERAADAFADRLLTRIMPPPPLGTPALTERGLAEQRFLWIVYQAGMLQHSRANAERNLLLEARLLATVAHLIDSVEEQLSDERLVAIYAARGATVNAEQVAEARRRISQARTCLSRSGRAGNE